MPNRRHIQLWLTCKDTTEAKVVTEVLLDKKLIACSKQIPVISDYSWKGSTESSKEILLVMDSVVELFNEVEVEIGKHHSYETFVLQSIPIIQVSKDAQKWYEEVLNV